MKKLVLFLIMLMTVGYGQAQTIGDHLNTIREQKPGGDVDFLTKPYTYTIILKDLNTIMMYSLDDNLICDKIIIAPRDSESRQRWINSFNDGWVVISSTNWKFYKNDGTILNLKTDYVDSIGPIFIISEEKSLN